MLENRSALMAPPIHRERIYRFDLGDAVLLRIAGAPAQDCDGLRFPALREWSRRLQDLETHAGEIGEHLRDELTTLVGALPPEEPARAAIINLRRDIFNARMPKPATLTRSDQALPAGLRAELEQWQRAVTAHRDLAASGESILAAELGPRRAEARRLAGSDALRCAILLQSEVLEQHMDRYLRGGTLDKHGRQIERTLLEILYRATMKTSPFSTLTSVAMCQLLPHEEVVMPRLADSPRRHLARLNVAFLARVASAIGRRPDLRADLIVTLAPGARLEDDVVRYARRRTTQSSDESAIVSMDTVHESLFFLPSGPALSDVASAVSSGRITVADAALLVRYAGAEPRPAAEVDALLGHLLRLGLLLLPQLQLDLNSNDPYAGFIATLRGQAHPVLRSVGSHLERARTLTDDFATAPARDRSRLLGDIRAECAAAALLLESPGIVPRTILYEDTFRDVANGHLAREPWRRQLLPDLSRLASVLPAFDVNLPRRLTALGFFRARYGAGGTCADLQQFCHEFQRDFYDPYSRRIMRRKAFSSDNEFLPQENWFRLAQIGALDAARATASRFLGELAMSAPPGTTELQLGQAFVDTVQAQLGRHSSYAIPWSFFAQLTGDIRDPRARLVINQSYAGLTLMFSRFAHGLHQADPSVVPALAQVLRRAAPAGSVLAELRGGYETTNLNIHPVVTDFELVCPGDTSPRERAQQLHLDELEIRHDPEADELYLWSERLGARVIPIYLGFLMPMALPEIQQVLLCFSPAGMAQLDLWAGTGVPVPPDEVSHYPRLALGNLVLQRRMWKVPSACFPQRPARADDATYYAAVQAWRTKHGIPERVFAHVDFAAAATPSPDDGDEVLDDAGGRKASRKPLAVDFASWFSVMLLEHLVASAQSRLVITEALPSSEELWLEDEHDAYVSELLLEVYPTEEDDE